MSNEVATKKSGVVGALANLKKGIRNTKQSIPTSATDPFLKMGKDGFWVFGAANTDVEEGSTWAVNPLSIKHGFVAWTDRQKGEGKNELKGEAFVSMMDTMIDPNTLTKYEDLGRPVPWKAAQQCLMVCVGEDDEDRGTQVLFNTSSLGGANFFSALLDAIEKRLDAGEEDLVPIIELTSDHYTHKTYGKTYIPTFDIKGWSGLEDAELPTSEPNTVADEDEAEPEDGAEEVEDAEVIEETKPKTRRKAAKSDDKPKTEGRTRRRRRAE